MAPIPRIVSDPTLEEVDRIIEERENAQDARAYLGVSSIGMECSRALWMGFRWCSRKAFDAVTIRRFQDGHRSEAIMIERLRAVPGIQLWTTNPTENPVYPDEQIACSDIGGHSRGHLDGIILGLIQAPKTPHVWEHKCVNEKKQAKLLKLKSEKGEKQALAEWDATYWAQHILYMDYQSLTRGYLTCDSPGSRTTVSVRTDADPVAAMRLKEKARRIITAAEPPERISERPDWFQCQWCDHRATCHQEPAAPAIPAVNCRTCAHATPELDGDARWSCARYGCDLSVDAQRRGSECPAHVFIPALLPWKAVDADESMGWIEHQTQDGRTIRNGPTGYASREIAAGAGICGDVVVDRARETMGAEVVPVGEAA